MQPSPGIYHEKQQLLQCLVHTLNNLWQAPVFTARALDEIADKLTPPTLGVFSPHRTVLLGLGNYDVNVLQAALQQHGKEARWHDIRDADFSSLCFGEHCCDHDSRCLSSNVRRVHIALGSVDADAALLSAGHKGRMCCNSLILNVASSSWLTRSWGGRHWLALHRLDGCWYNLDSQAEQPVAYEDTAQLRAFLRQNITQHGATVLVVYNVSTPTP